MTGIQPGAIRVTAFLAGDVVQRVSIAADRPVSLASALIGRPIGFVGEAAAALHGLCGQSHAAAVRFAAVAAGGTAVPEEEIVRWVVRLAGERLAEHLRWLFTMGDDLATLRAAIAMGQGAARSGVVAADDVSRTAAAVFGLSVMTGESASVSWPAGRAREGGLFRPSTASPPIVPQVVDGRPEAGHDTFNKPAAIDVLTFADDRVIIAALTADAGFIRTPHLPGRVPETGPAARLGLSAADPDAAFGARRAEIREAFAVLVSPGSSEPWIRSEPIGPNAGYAAVETPRGRLYYRIVLDDTQQLLDARVLAPTEWNFHPDGPLVHALIGFRPGSDPVAAITRRAAAFDPCVELRVSAESLPDA